MVRRISRTISKSRNLRTLFFEGFEHAKFMAVYYVGDITWYLREYEYMFIQFYIYIYTHTPSILWLFILNSSPSGRSLHAEYPSESFWINSFVVSIFHEPDFPFRWVTSDKATNNNKKHIFFGSAEIFPFFATSRKIFHPFKAYTSSIGGLGFWRCGGTSSTKRSTPKQSAERPDVRRDANRSACEKRGYPATLVGWVI